MEEERYKLSVIKTTAKLWEKSAKFKELCTQTFVHSILKYQFRKLYRRHYVWGLSKKIDT